MRARQAVLLTSSKSSGPPQLLSCKQTTPITHAESTLLQVFILKSLKLFRMNTYKKHRGRGVPPTFAARNAQKLVAHLPFFSIACAMPLKHLLSFDNLPFSWGVAGGLPSHALLTSAPSGDRLAEV
jgi:hypothetical protein